MWQQVFKTPVEEKRRLHLSCLADAHMKNREILFFEKRTYPQSLLFLLGQGPILQSSVFH